MKFAPQMLALVVVVLMFSACNSEVAVVENQVIDKDIVNENLPIVGLDDVSSVEVLVGQKMVYGYDLWPSVGYDADYSIDDTDIVAFLEKDEYTPSQPSGFTGGDDGHGTFYFVAKSPGSTTIEIEHLFRGDIEKTVSVRIDVK